MTSQDTVAAVDSSNNLQNRNMKTAVVTGGGGYVGNELCIKLLEYGYSSVIALDVQFISKSINIKRIKSDIRNIDQLRDILKEYKPDVIFHVASYGMSGHQMFDKDMIESVNIQGTKNIIKVCVELNIQHIVYTSTYNVVFGGQKIVNGSTSLPYFPLDQHVDHYSRTKSIAEQTILAADGTPLKGNNVLKTCALRCAGIYGEGEQRHLPRIVKYLRNGLVLFTWGEKDSLVDFLHVDNFVKAHILAAEELTSTQSVTSGKAYFISDNRPINNFQFFKPLMTGLGYTYPKLRLSLWIVYYLAYLIEILYGLMSKCYKFQPFLTRAEVFKAGVTHYFSIEEATRDFGYKPEIRNLDGVVKWFIDKGHHKRDNQSSYWFIIMAVLLLFLTVNMIVIYYHQCLIIYIL